MHVIYYMHIGLFQFIFFFCSLVRFIFFMDSILINLSGVCCFVDDILVAAKAETEHLNRLKAVFKRCRKMMCLSSRRNVSL